MTRVLRRSLYFIALVLPFGAGLASCGSKSVPAETPAPGKKVDATTAAAVIGHVTFTGTPPPVEMVRMTTDPACVKEAGPSVPSDAVVISATGDVANAFAYIKSGLDPSYAFDVPTEAVLLDQKGCRYVPHVIGVRVGQPLKIVNSDPTLHNVHAMPMINQEFNQGQPLQGVPITKTFTAPEVMVRFVCNVHGWMRAYVGVRPDPFWAVTAADGRFKIAGLPPGSYTIAIWHEKFGEQEQHITLAAQQTLDVPFSFAAK